METTLQFFRGAEEEVTRQIANSSNIEYVKFSFEEVITGFDLLDKLADGLAAFSTQEAQNCLDNELHQHYENGRTTF